MIATCPSSDRLHAFVLGHLQDQESDELYGHLAGCDSCQQQLEESGSFSDTFVGQLKSDTAEEDHTAEPALLQATDRAKNILSLLNRPAPDIAADDPAEPVPHTIGEYEIDRLIGRGGMGTVYLARHTKLGRQVALKILSRHRLADPKMQGRFSSEMKAVGRMNHPNIVAAHDAREIDGVAVLVTEYIDGLNVGSIIRRTGPLSVANAARIASEVATALAAIDTAGLIHRDIKPSNIMVSRSGAVKLLDLGLARLQTADSEHHEHREHTATGQALGTVDYISPEQVNDGRNIDVRADIYALGCTLFKMLTGQPVFDDAQYPTAFAKMTAHVQTPPPSVTALARNIPEPLATLVAEMLDKDPSLRPQTPSTLIERLSPFTGNADLAALVEKASTSEEKPRANRPQTASAPTPFRSTNSSRKFPRTPLLIATALGGLVLGWAISWLMGIEITIKHPDGTTTKLNVANGSTVTIDENGNATVVPPGIASDSNLRTRSAPDQEVRARQNISDESSANTSELRSLPNAADSPYRGPSQPNVALTSDGSKVGGTTKAVQDPLAGIWRFAGPNRFEGGYLVLGQRQFAIIGNSEKESIEGIWRHNPDANPPQLDLEFTKNAPPDPQLGIYQLSRIYMSDGSNTQLMRIWFAQPGKGRLDKPVDNAAMIELESVNLNIFENGPVPADMAKARRKLQELLDQGPTTLDDNTDDLPAANIQASDEIPAKQVEPGDGEKIESPDPAAKDDQWSVDPSVPDQLPGVWKFASRNRFEGAYLILANARFCIVGGPNEEGKSSGKWQHDSKSTPPRFDLEFSGGVPDPQLGIYGLNADGELKVWFAQPGKDRLNKQQDGTDQLVLSRVDWSAITAPEQLPDKISRDAWKEWKRLNTGEPAANLDNRIFNLTAPIIEESIQGVWKSMHSLPDSEEFWIYSNGKVAVSGGKNSDPEKRGMNHLSGTYTIKPADPHGLDVFVIRHQFSDRVDQKHMIFTKSNLDNLTARIVELAEPGLAPASKTEYLFNERFQRLDWSAITAPEQLPDKISRDTWQAWKELSADIPKDVSPVPQPLNVQGIDPAMIPSSTLTAESIEGVWKFDLKDKGVWGFRMFENGMSRFFLKPSTGEVLGFNIKTGSPYTLNVANATAQIDFNKFVESGSEGSKCIWRINDDGSLEIAEPFLADGSRPISFGAIPKNAVPLGKMEKVDWSNINHAGQLPDQFTRQAWAAWLELNLARPKTNRELLQGLWRVASVVVDDKPQLLDKWNIDYLAVDGTTIHSFRRSDSEVAHSQSPTALDPAQSDQMQLVFGSGDDASPPDAFSVVGKIRFGRRDDFSFDCVLSGGDAPTELLGKKMTITFERMMSGEEVAELSLEELKKKSPYDFPVLKQFKEIVPEMLPPETLDVETD